MQLFKYCKREHMEAMLERGAARIGTLFGWRESDKHGEMSSDEFEGVMRHSGNLIFYDATHIGAFEHHPEDSTITVEGEGANQVRHFETRFIRASNVYAFAASAEYSEAQHNAWLRTEGYDACYRINSAKLFFRALTKAIAPTDFLLFARVHYVPAQWDNLELVGPFHPALLNRAGGYDDQNEIRALWRPQARTTQIEPVIIETSRASIYCAQYRVI